MEFFEDLASEVHKAWMHHRRDELAFSEVAQSMLEHFAPASAIKPDDLFNWLIAADHIPRQFDPRTTFGNFALTVAARDDFHVDVLVWTDGTTAIHQHSFSGAFHVLHGSSLQSLWSFQESRRWGGRLKSGQVAVRTTEWLGAGSTRPILPGAAMIHSLFHLDSPSVTVVVRTPSSASSQFSYERSGLAYDTHGEFVRVEKIRQLLSTLWTSDHPQRMALSEGAISAVDEFSAVRIILAKTTPAGAQAHLIDVLAGRDPELAALLRDTVSRRERDRALIDLRRQTQSPRHRMLLALVLNLPDRTSIDSVLCEVAPAESPENWLWDTILSMHETRGKRHEGESVLGFTLNEISEEVLKMLLHGHSVDEVSKTVAGHEELVEDVRALCLTLSALPVLSPLLVQRSIAA